MRVCVYNDSYVVPILQIHRAIYRQHDHHHEHIDLTGHVRGLINDNSLVLDGNHHHINGDPFPGVPKELVIDFSIGYGPVEQVILNDFQPHTIHGGHVPHFHLLSAHYAVNENKHVDVTEKLRAISHHEHGLQLSGNHNALVGDPFPGEVKYLDIEYYSHGQLHKVKVVEGEYAHLN